MTIQIYYHLLFIANVHIIGFYSLVIIRNVIQKRYFIALCSLFAPIQNLLSKR